MHRIGAGPGNSDGWMGDINSGSVLLFTCTAPVSSIDLQRESIKKQLESIQKQAAGAVQVKSKTEPEFISPIQPSLLPGPAPISFLQMDCPALSAKEADRLISFAAEREQLSPDILKAVIRQESGFKPCAVSEKGAEGLMQLMPETARELNVANPFDPEQNVRGGAALLKRLLARYGGDLSLALGAYNAGATRVDEAGGVPEIDETQNYVASILSDLDTETKATEAEPKDVTANANQSVVLHVSLDPDQISPAIVRVSVPK